MKLSKITTLNPGLDFTTMSVNSRDQLVIRGQSYGSDEQFICTMARRAGNKAAEIKSECHHRFCPIIEHLVDPDFILEACFECGEIRSYNINTAESKTVYSGCKPRRICKGPEGSVFVIDKTDGLLQLEWRKEKEELDLVHRIQTGMKNAWGICYMEQYKILVITSYHNIKAINPETGSVLWEFTQDEEGKKLFPREVCCDVDGRIYVADGTNEQLIVLNDMTGELIQVLLKDKYWVFDMCWTSFPPQLTVCHGGNLPRIGIYDVTEQ